MTKTGLEFGISVIVICLIFGICDLEFQSFQYFTKARNLYRQSHLTLTPARRDLGLALRTRFSILNKKSSQRLLFSLTINLRSYYSSRLLSPSTILLGMGLESSLK